MTSVSIICRVVERWVLSATSCQTEGEKEMAPLGT